MKKEYKILIVAFLAAGVFWIFQSEGSFSEGNARLAADYILKSQNPDGLFLYEYLPKRDSYSRGNNIVRQAGAVYALSQAADYFQEEKYFQAARKAVDRFIAISETRNEKGKNARFVRFGGGIQTNTNALLVLAIVELAKNPELEEVYSTYADEFAEHIIASQREDGLFYNKYNKDKNLYYDAPSDYNNGESFLALARLYAITPKKEYEIVLSKASSAFLDYYGGKWNKSFYSWGVNGFIEFYKSTKNPQYKKFVYDITDLMLESRYFKDDGANNTALAVFLEGLIPAYHLAREEGDTQKEFDYKIAAEKGLSKISKLQVLEQNDFDPFVFKKMKGGFCSNLSCERMRIDDTQHGLSAFLALKSGL